MKMIYLYGESDFSALDFEKSKPISVNGLYDLAVENGGKVEYEYTDAEGYDDTLYVSAYVFGEVDPRFIDFVRNNIEDYDRAKAATFYIVE